MTEEKPYISPSPEADGNYKYYCVGSIIPVRVTINKRKLKIFAECPDHKKDGVLMPNIHMLSVIRKEDDVTSVTKEEFVDLVRDYMSNRRKHLPRSEFKND